MIDLTMMAPLFPVFHNEGVWLSSSSPNHFLHLMVFPSHLTIPFCPRFILILFPCSSTSTSGCHFHLWGASLVSRLTWSLAHYHMYPVWTAAVGYSVFDVGVYSANPLLSLKLRRTLVELICHNPLLYFGSQWVSGSSDCCETGCWSVGFHLCLWNTAHILQLGYVCLFF